MRLEVDTFNFGDVVERDLERACYFGRLGGRFLVAHLVVWCYERFVCEGDRFDFPDPAGDGA